jgi:hypothetical protein
MGHSHLLISKSLSYFQEAFHGHGVGSRITENFSFLKRTKLPKFESQAGVETTLGHRYHIKRRPRKKEKRKTEEWRV